MRFNEVMIDLHSLKDRSALLFQSAHGLFPVADLAVDSFHLVVVLVPFITGEFNRVDVSGFIKTLIRIKKTIANNGAAFIIPW